MFFVTQAAVSAMAAQGKGVVINVTSVHAFLTMHGHSVYTGTKGTVVAFTRELALEIGSKNIRVNAIAPACIVVENYTRTAPDLDLEDIARCLPVDHVGAPRDVAHLAVFLASDEVRFITGQTYVIDGGQSTSAAIDDSFRCPNPDRWGTQYVPSV